MKTKMEQTGSLGTDFWNDSCSPRELGEAVAQGAVGATSNPVIVFNVVKQEPELWLGTIDRLIRDNPGETEDEIAWRLIETVGTTAARVLLPAFEQSRGLKGRLSLQVNPKLYRDPVRMLDHAKKLSALAPNIAIKLPCTLEGLIAVEEATACGICVNVTVSFTLPQAVAAAGAIERGLARAEKAGIDTGSFAPYVTIMVGRLDDHFKRIASAEHVMVEPGHLEWAGIAVFKKAYGIFRERGYRSTLLAAAYRNTMHWAELIGGAIVLSIPYEWWQRYNASDVEVWSRIDAPVDPSIVGSLLSHFPDFSRAFETDGMSPAEFVRFGASVHTLKQFIGGYHNLLEYVRERMLR